MKNPLKEAGLVIPEITATACWLASSIYDSGIDKNPRAYPPLIENHFGNFKWGLSLFLTPYLCSRSLGISHPKSLIMGGLSSALGNVAIELFTPNNYEFGGDVIMGLAGSVVALGMLGLLPRKSSPAQTN